MKYNKIEEKVNEYKKYDFLIGSLLIIKECFMEKDTVEISISNVENGVIANYPTPILFDIIDKYIPIYKSKRDEIKEELMETGVEL